MERLAAATPADGFAVVYTAGVVSSLCMTLWLESVAGVIARCIALPTSYAHCRLQISREATHGPFALYMTADCLVTVKM